MYSFLYSCWLEEHHRTPGSVVEHYPEIQQWNVWILGSTTETRSCSWNTYGCPASCFGYIINTFINCLLCLKSMFLFSNFSPCRIYGHQSIDKALLNLAISLDLTSKLFSMSEAIEVILVQRSHNPSRLHSHLQRPRSPLPIPNRFADDITIACLFYIIPSENFVKGHIWDHQFTV